MGVALEEIVVVAAVDVPAYAGDGFLPFGRSLAQITHHVVTGDVLDVLFGPGESQLLGGPALHTAAQRAGAREIVGMVHGVDGGAPAPERKTRDGPVGLVAHYAVTLLDLGDELLEEVVLVAPVVVVEPAHVLPAVVLAAACGVGHDDYHRQAEAGTDAPVGDGLHVGLGRPPLIIGPGSVKQV